MTFSIILFFKRKQRHQDGVDPQAISQAHNQSSVYFSLNETFAQENYLPFQQI